MPHIILRGTSSLGRIHDGFEPARIDGNGWIIKLRACFLANNHRVLLIDTTAVRSGFSQDFFLRAEQKGESITIRIDPYMRIEHNEGVHRAIVSAAKLLLDSSSSVVFDKSNLPPDLLQDHKELLRR